MTTWLRSPLAPLLGAGLLLAAVAALATPASSPGTEPGYDGFRVLLRQGDGKDDTDGVYELYQYDPNLPTAWERVAEDPVTKEITDVLILGPTYVAPDPKGEVPVDWQPIEGATFPDLAAFVDWIVDTYPHIQGPDDLTILEPSN
jgi:hypothetical protein